MSVRTAQLQIRVTPEEKVALKRLARAAGQGVSRYVLSQVLPSTQLEFDRLVRSLELEGADSAATLSDLRGLFLDLSPREFSQTVSDPELGMIPPILLNYVAAMVEQAAHTKGVDPPAWVHEVAVLERPHFVWGLRSLRPHQIRVTPVPFKRRNLFMDPAVGMRV